MSSHSYSTACPKCEGSMNINSENRPYDRTYGECLECGFVFYPTESRMSLEEVNEQRVDAELEPLKELKKQIHDAVEEEEYNTIKIIVKGGYVQEVKNIPAGFDYEIDDQD